MRLTEIAMDGQRPVDGYGGGGFRVDGTWHRGSLILLPSGIQPLDGEPSIDGLAPVFATAGALDVLLVGMGADIAPLPQPLRAALEEAGIGVEVMSTASACRTYNVLLTEARRVAAALVAI